MTKSDFFFCYNKRLFTYICQVKNIPYITIGINPSNKKLYSMFIKSIDLQKAIDDYKQYEKLDKV